MVKKLRMLNNKSMKITNGLRKKTVSSTSS
jgi:hypothetical protein